MNILPIGDSKTLNYIWPSLITSAIYKANVDLFASELPTRIAANNATVATQASTITADLSAAVGIPDYVLINFGANDVAALPSETIWKANYNMIIDALQAKWTNAKIYLMRPWRRNYGVECNTLASWIADIIAAQGIYTGPDERIFLEGGDDGATMTVDGIHPSPAGVIATAVQWQAAIGF